MTINMNTFSIYTKLKVIQYQSKNWLLQHLCYSAENIEVSEAWTRTFCCFSGAAHLRSGCQCDRILKKASSRWKVLSILTCQREGWCYLASSFPLQLYRDLIDKWKFGKFKVYNLLIWNCNIIATALFLPTSCLTSEYHPIYIRLSIYEFGWTKIFGPLPWATSFIHALKSISRSVLIHCG